MLLHNRWLDELELKNQFIYELCLGEDSGNEGLLLK